MNLDLKPFALERYFAKYEFTLKHNLSGSDCEPLSVAELFALAGRDLKDLHELKLGYTEPRGGRALRECIAKLCDDTGANQSSIGQSDTKCSPENVIVAAPQELITLTLGALCTGGGPVVVLTPCYQSLHEIVRAAGVQVRELKVREHEGVFEIDTDEARDLLRGAKGLVVNFPHNPTGLLPKQKTFDTLAEHCAAEGAWIFSDEMYRGAEPDHKRLAMASARYDNATSLSGLSKSYGLAGLRLGYITTKDVSLQHEVLKRKDYTTICAPGPSEVIGQVAFEARDLLWQKHRACIAKNTALLKDFVDQNNVFEWREPGGPLVYLRTQLPALEVCERARSQSVLLLPSTVFDEKDAHHIRFGLGRVDFEEGLSALARAFV